MSEDLPSGWAEVSLAGVVSQPRSKVSPADYPDLPFIGMDHIAPGGMDLLGSVPFGSMKSNGGLFLEGDVLYGRMRPYLNKVHRAKSAGACSAEFIVFPKSEAIDGDFLAYTLHHRRFVNFASAQSSGDRPRVDFGDLSKYKFAVPPVGEQKRIVSKIDELFSRINEGERALEQVSKLVERYRQSVLKAAVTGELTRGWREARKAAGQSIESGETLLTRILTARREAWEADELAKMKAKRITPKGDAWKKKYEDPMPPDTTGLPDLPEGWVWASLSQLSRSSSYGTSSKCSYEKTGIAVLRIPNIRSGRLDFSDIKYAAPDLDIADSSLLSYGDLLVVRTNGSASLIGVGCVVTDSTPMPCYFASYLIRFRLALPTELSAWVNLCWQSHVVRAFVDRHKATSAGQYNVSQSSLMGLCLPLGPANEMRSAADEVERLMSDAGAVSDSAISELRASSALRQSILKAAFGGRLVPQDQRDEPASTLLERIAVECGANNVAQKGGRKKKSA